MRRATACLLLSISVLTTYETDDLPRQTRDEYVRRSLKKGHTIYVLAVTQDVFDVGPGDWAAVGQAESSGKVLQSGWISCQSGQPADSVHGIEFGLSVMSAVR